MQKLLQGEQERKLEAHTDKSNTDQTSGGSICKYKIIESFGV
jgi:hypothetical protein